MNRLVLATILTSAVALAQGRFGEMHVMGMHGMNPGQAVVGSPFSGQEVTTQIETLANGTHITHTMTTQFYRDANGRTRVERTFSKEGPWSTNGKATTMVEISDPIAGARYFLNPAQQTGTKELVSAAHAGNRPKQARGDFAQATTTNLGSQTIQGLTVTGTLSTRVIPVGKMGNDQPITITDERWYSPDLQMVILTKHMDPRNGETDFAIQNISRTAPDASLFTPPASYAITTATPGRGRGGPGMPPPPPEE
jgi:hypothetical protein